MIKASVYIICQNEEKNIKRVLESVKDFAEIILVDSGSTDKTLEIAANYKNCLIKPHKWLGYAKQKQYALSLCNNDWVLNLDADEELSEKLKQIISNTIRDNNVDALSCPVVGNDLLLKKAHPLTTFNKKIRFFKKNKGYYKNVSVHESIFINGTIKKVRAPIYHHGYESLEKSIEKMNNYSSLRAKDKLNRGKKPSLLKLIFIFPLMFFKSYIIKRSFLNGMGGFINSMVQAFYAFLKEAKLVFLYYDNPKNH